MNLNELKDRAYKIAKAHGWHDKKLSDETYLMLIITEIAEAVQADWNGKHANISMFNANCNTPQVRPERHWKYIYELFIKNSVEDELADVVIRSLDLAGLHSIDLSDAMSLIDKLTSVICKKETDGTFVELMFELVKIISPEDIELNIKVNAILLCVVELCRSKNIDIDWHVEQKMRYNELRPYRHGGKAY